MPVAALLAGALFASSVRASQGNDLRADYVRLPDLIRRIDHYYPAPGAAPPGPPLPDVVVIKPRRWFGYALTALLAGGVGVAATLILT